MFIIFQIFIILAFLMRGKREPRPTRKQLAQRRASYNAYIAANYDQAAIAANPWNPASYERKPLSQGE